MTMTLLRRFSLGAVLIGSLLASNAGAQDLASFAVLAGSTVTNTNVTVIDGNVGVSPGGAITGFPPGIVNAPYSIHASDAVAAAAQSQLTTAYNVLASRQTTADLTGQDLGGMTLVAGVYNFNTSAQLTGVLTLDAQGDPNAVFVFNIGSTLTTAAASEVLLINGATAGNVFYRVGSSATLLAASIFKGKIIALTSITLVSGASINCGAALARNGAVTLDNNVIGICPTVTAPIGGGGGGGGGTPVGPGDAIDDVVSGGGSLPIGFQILALLSPAELADALSQLSGESVAGTSYTTGQAMDVFLETIMNGRGGPGAIIAPGSAGPDEGPGEGTVSVMGYAQSAPEQPAFGAFDARTPDVGHWDVWASGYGGYTLTGGDVAAGTTDRSSAAYGLLFGFDRTVSEDAMFGFAISGGGTNFNLDDSLGSGRSAMLQAAAYGQVDSDRAYLSGAAAYGIHDMHTVRTVTFAGFDRFTSRFLMQDVAAEVEAGYHVGWFTPYVALRGQAIFSPAHGETTVAGASTYALDYAAQTVLTARTEIGARADWSKDFESSTLSVHARAAWAHTFATDRRLEASFQALPGSSFLVGGAKPAADAILLSLGGDVTMDTGLSLGLSLDSSLSLTAQSYAGSVHLGYSW